MVNKITVKDFLVGLEKRNIDYFVDMNEIHIKGNFGKVVTMRFKQINDNSPGTTYREVISINDSLYQLKVVINGATLVRPMLTTLIARLETELGKN